MSSRGIKPARKPPQRIGIIGAGQWGTTLAWLCSKNCADVRLFDRNAARAKTTQSSRVNAQYAEKLLLPETIRVSSELDFVVSGSALIFVAVPSQNMRETAKNLARHIGMDQYLVHGTKGLEHGTRKRMSEVLSEETNCLRVGVLSGPNLADEIIMGLPAATVIASRYDEVIHSAQAALSTPDFLVYGNHDIIGAEWIGTLKNVLAVASGLVQELKLGRNAQALILTQGLAEIQTLFDRAGAKTNTLLGLSGLGDIFATCTSPHSRNFRAGMLLANKKNAAQAQKELRNTVEGLSTIKIVAELIETLHLSLPVIEALNRCAFENGDPLLEFQRLLKHPLVFDQNLSI